ncbi:Mediator of RNA polymerase II transcription subunit 32, partial [Linum grandiflorum]
QLPSLLPYQFLFFNLAGDDLGATIPYCSSRCDRDQRVGQCSEDSTDALLEKFKQKWELFRVACDQAEEIVESAKQRVESECLVDEATGAGTATVTPSLAPMNAVRLEQMTKAVRRMMIELQHGSGAAAGTLGHVHPFPLFNA